MKKIFGIIGKSSAGKDFLTSAISKELNIPIATSFTTRNPRVGEIEGREYFFISHEVFMNKIQSGEIAECTSYNVADNMTWYYGLTKEELEKGDYILAIINKDGLEQLTETYGDKMVSIFIECDGLERLQRSINRDKSANPRELCRRFLDDELQLSDIKCDYIVYNDNDSKSEAIQKLKDIILEEMEIE